MLPATDVFHQFWKVPCCSLNTDAALSSLASSYGDSITENLDVPALRPCCSLVSSGFRTAFWMNASGEFFSSEMLSEALLQRRFDLWLKAFKDVCFNFQKFYFVLLQTVLIFLRIASFLMSPVYLLILVFHQFKHRLWSPANCSIV